MTAVYGYQWIRHDGDAEADIPGAAAQTYTLTSTADEGNRIQVRASFVDDAGNAETRTSARTGTVAVSATAPKITIAPDRAKATGRFDFIRYTVAREGPATDALTVTVRLEAPAGNDWAIDDDKRSHEVAFRAGEAEKTLDITLRTTGPGNIGFSHAATQGGTLLARLDGTTGYDTADTAEVEVVVVPNPLWIARLTQPAYTFIEDGTNYGVEIEVAAASPDMPAPSMRPDGNNPFEVFIETSERTALAHVDYEPFGRNLPIPTSSFMAGPDGVQRGRAVFRFAALQDSEPEGAETLRFVIERAPIVPIGAITFEGPDGRRVAGGVRYPVTIVEANTPASGVPAIAGTGRAGETLRATTEAVSDVDGLGEFTYRWVRVDGSVETEIGTGAATYLPVADDVGKRIRVEVAFADALGFAEGPLASDSVAIRAAAPPAVCPVLDLAGTGRSALAPIRVGVGAIQVFKVPVAYGYYTGDAVLSAGGTIGGGSFALGGTAYAVEGAWAGTGGSLVFNLDGAVSAAERAALALHVCGESYAFADAEHDPSTDAYTWRHAGLDWSSVTSRTLRLSTTRSLPTGAPEIEGTARIGETLEAATDAIADADGLSSPGFAYQWIRVEGVEETEISGAVARTYTVTAEDLGKAVRVRVRFTDDRSFAEEATSAALPIVNTPATGAPEIRGSGRVGGTMQAATGGIVEPDGLGNAVFSYRWVRLDGAEETEVGTDSDSYGVVAADEGKRIRVEVTFTDDLGAAEGPLASIPATVLDASPPLSSSCGTPALAGRVQIWNSRVTLSSFSGGIGFDHEQSGRRLQDPDFVIASAPAYTFLSALNFIGGSRNGGLRFELDRALAPSHAASLVLHDCDDSFAFADAAYNASDRTYSWPAAGADWRGLPLMRQLRLSVPGNNPATGAPGIAGTARIGETLTALTGGIGDVDGRSGASFAYRWLRVEGETATAISGATAGTYTLADDDEGNRVKVEVTFTDDLGSSEGPLESAPFPAAGTVAPVPAPMTDPSDLLSATLTVKEKSPNLGCFATGSGVLCSSSSVMTGNDFTVGTVDYFITQIYLQTDGSVLLEFGETVRRDVTGSWTLTLGTTELVFNDAARNGGEYTWTGTGLGWTADDTVAVKVTDRGTGDTTPPAHAGPSRVTSGGDRLVLVFSEALDHATLPATDRYTVEADGSPIAVVAVDDPLSENERLGLALASPVYQGQTVTVRYADPSDADDARAVQDAAGNDAASFTSAVRNDSDHTGAPGAPTGLEATANGPTRIDLAWRAPVERGDSDITGYRIEFSPDGVSDWRDLMEDTGERAVAYSDTRVVPAETRHYRVSAINGQGPGEPSEPAAATTVSALPKIAGQPRVGATLRVETGDIGDLDGVDPATFEYQWIRIDGPSETEISGATGETYELVEADAGKRIRVKVSFTDGGGNREERASEAFPARGTVAENTPATGAPAIAGSGRVGGMLRAQTDAIADADGLSNAEFRYRWVRLDGPEIPDATATGETYAAVADDLGKRIRVEVEFTDDHGSPEGPLASVPVTIRAMSAPASCPRPGLADRRWIWSGTVTVGPVESSTSGVVRTVGHGFAAAGGVLRAGGALSDRDFELGANGYTVSQGFAATGGELRFYLDRALAAADSAGLVLYVCGETYAFADAALHDDGDGFEYSWPGAGLDWSALAGMTRTLVLSVADPGAPGAPSGLTATAVGGTRIDLSWTGPADPGVIGYRIEWSADGRSGWRDLVANTGSTDRTHADTVAPETTRHYRVSAINGQGPGSPSEVARARSGAPGAPRKLVATANDAMPGDSSTQIDLGWEEPADRGGSAVTGYRIEWSADGTSNWRELAADTGSTDRAYRDTDLPPETTRHYRVSAINGQGTGQASNTASATTDDVVAPVLVEASVFESGLTVFLLFADAINPATLPMASAFTVSADGVRVDVGNVDFIVEVGGITIRLRNISPAIKRGQSVVVTYTDPNPGSDDATGVIQDTGGNDAASFTTGVEGVPAVVNNSVAAPVAPDAPAGLMAEAAGDTGIVLTWSPPAYNGGSAVTGYLIEVSPDGTDGSFTTREANHDVREGGGEDGAIVTAYTHTGLTRATTRHYRVKAINAAGTGAASGSDFATTTMVAPGAPTGLAATAHDAMPGDTSTQIDLAWTAPAAIEGVAPPTGYRIEWSPDGTSDWEELVANHNTMAAGAIVTAYSDAGLPSETTRHYRVFAINAAGTGAASGTDFATTTMVEPGAPTGLAATAHDAMPGDTSTQIDLAWTAPAAIEGIAAPTGYRIEWSPDGASDWEELVANHNTMAAGAIVTAYSDAGLPSETTRHYRVFAINAGGAGPPSNVDDATTEDIAGPVVTGANTTPSGNTVILHFDERFDVSAEGAPPTSAFSAVVDGVPLGFGTFTHNIAPIFDDFQIWFTDISPNIKRGQRVTVTYTDPTPGDDAQALQDVHGHDAASFTRTVRNDSIFAPTRPGATDRARGDGERRHAGRHLHADRPRLDRAGGDRWGVPAPTGYRIEWSPDGTSDWEELVEDTGTTDVAYSDAGLPLETTRHYRVFAINASGTGPPSNVDDATTEDLEPPTGRQTPFVHFDGVYISIRYDQPLDAADATEPLPSAFTVIADGIPITIGDVTVEVLVIGLGALSPTIKRGQVVTVTYTDPTDGDDARAIQDVHGNDAASYTVQADNDSDVDPILPGAPTGLTATANDAMQGDTSTQIDLAWVAPGEIGSGIKGYLIEVSPDGTEDSFTTLEASHDTMEDGEIVTAYADTGLPSETTRYYRVKAISAAGTTSATDVAHDTTADIVAPVLSYVAVVFDTMRIQFNEALDGAPGHTPPKSAFTVTADGFPTDFDTVSVSGPAAVLQGFSPTIKAGQTVTVTYTDANAGDDTAAIQDLAGNDAAGFTTGEDGVPAVVLGGPLAPPVAPDAPAGLTATAAGETRIDLAWSPPAYNGGSAVTGYLIEVSKDGTDGSLRRRWRRTTTRWTTTAPS